MNDPRFKVLLSFLVSAIALLGYWSGGFVWQNREEEIDKKIFGVYRSEFGFPPRIARSIESPALGAKVTELVASRLLEASGVAVFDDRLAIVSDKDNALYIVNTEVPASPLTMIEVPEFPDEPAKFEDISFHRDSGYFYVIGAHNSTVPAFQKAFRFKLRREGDCWRPIQVEPLSISKDILNILDHLSDKNHVEGIAVTGSTEAPTLFIGIRSGKQGRFLVLEFSSERSGFVLQSSHKLSLSPTHASGDVAYHLSGLMVVSDSELLVLAASEDEFNSFHGNRVYIVDLHEWIQKSVTSEFALAQKAEGIAVWTAGKSKGRIAIVFDNDRLNTGQPSRLLIANTLDSL